MEKGSFRSRKEVSDIHTWRASCLKRLEVVGGFKCCFKFVTSRLATYYVHIPADVQWRLCALCLEIATL